MFSLKTYLVPDYVTFKILYRKIWSPHILHESYVFTFSNAVLEAEGKWTAPNAPPSSVAANELSPHSSQNAVNAGRGSTLKSLN